MLFIRVSYSLQIHKNPEKTGKNTKMTDSDLLSNYISMALPSPERHNTYVYMS